MADPNPARRDIPSEHGVMSALDEFMLHGAPVPVRISYTSDPRAYERLWFTAQDHGGQLYVVTGLGFYPNLNTAEAYAIVNHRGRHSYIHAHRPLGNNLMDTSVGPLRFDVVEAFKDWHLTLASNAYGIEFDLHWYDTKRAVFHTFGGGGGYRPMMGNQRSDDTAGYETFGRIEGTVTIDGERFEMSAESGMTPELERGNDD